MTRDSVVLKKIRVLLARRDREQLINKFFQRKRMVFYAKYL